MPSLTSLWSTLGVELTNFGIGSNFWQCLRAGAQAIADARTPGMTPSEVDNLAVSMIRAIRPELKNQLTGQYFNRASPPVSAVGPLGPVVLPGGGGGCVTADLFTDVFNVASGAIPACPGALDGWCRPNVGTASLTGSSLIMNETSPTVRKATGSIIPASNLRGRFEFLEGFECGIGVVGGYQQMVVTSGGMTTLLFLGTDGEVTIVGPGISFGGFTGGTGLWTPQGAGAHRFADWAIASDGTPSVSIDGVVIALAPANESPDPATANNTELSFFTNGAAGQIGVFLGAWLASGSTPFPPLDCGYCS